VSVCDHHISHKEIALAFGERNCTSGVRQISQPYPKGSIFEKILNAEISLRFGVACFLNLNWIILPVFVEFVSEQCFCYPLIRRIKKYTLAFGKLGSLAPVPKQKKILSPTERSSKLRTQRISTPYLSVVVPVFNEEECIEEFFTRLTEVLESIGKTYEIIFINDGSCDRTEYLLGRFFEQYPRILRIIHFNNNYGQYTAILAGFEHVRGDVIVTLDADLQNPPEEIPSLLKMIDAGHDSVGSYRRERHDSFFRTKASRVINRLRKEITGLEMRDHGCMLRAYRRHIIDQAIKTRESSTFITVLAQKFAGNPIDIAVEHHDRARGESKYNLYKLIRITFDLITGVSLIPLQLFTLLGMCTSLLSVLLVVYMGFRRIFIGPEAEGVFTLFAILFFFLSVIIMGIGLIGEYVGRTYLSVCQHPRFVIREIIEMSQPKREE
jgi:undecaprenyl-phosphate 4-deoxy-4-formamido-L-arabinose transferase